MRRFFVVDEGGLLSGFGSLDDGFECLGLADGQLGQDLAVEGDAGFLDSAHEGGVGDTELVHAGIDAGDPEAAEIALLVAAIAVLVLEGLQDGLAGLADAGTTDKAVAFSLSAQFLVFGVGSDAAFDSHYL